MNPFVPSGWVGTCQFPQITAGGLADSWQHGADLYAVYHDRLGFLPGREDDWRSRVAYRVTQNVITSQVAGMVIGGMWGAATAVPLVIEAANVDSLEPQYGCPAASQALEAIRSSPTWNGHLDAARGLYATLDDISGVSPSDAGFHASFDHYYDNLSARQCHAKPLPCKLVAGTNSSTCATQALADDVYRLGHWGVQPDLPRRPRVPRCQRRLLRRVGRRAGRAPPRCHGRQRRHHLVPQHRPRRESQPPALHPADRRHGLARHGQRGYL